MGLWNLLFGWRKRVDTAHAPVPAPQMARRRRKSARVIEGGASRHCRFERMEERQMLDADPLKLGVVYIEEDGGSDLHGDTFEMQFQGGAPGTELTRVVIDGDHGPQGISVGDMIFDTSLGGLGADQSFAFQLVSMTGGGSVTASVVDGSSQLILDFTGFQAGDKLRFSIDVDEIQQFDPAVTDLFEINSGVDPISSGVEFQDSLLTGTFQESHHYDVSGTIKFKNVYDPLFAGTNLLISSGNASGLPHDDYQGKRDRSTGALLPLQQRPLPSSLSGYVYHDANNNAVYDSGESPIPGTTILLLDASGTQVTQQTTDQDGFYKFDGLSAGNYCIIEIQPAGWIDGQDAAGNIGGVTVGQADNPGDKIANIDLNLAEFGVHYDFGELLPGSIEGRVFFDPNEDCFFNEGDQPLSGVTIQLLNEQGAVIQTTQTAADGQYRFDNLPPGTYAVRELQPPGYLQGGTVPGSGGGDASVEDLISAIDISSGARLAQYDFCEIKPVSIAGRVFVDLNNNCLFDGEERPLSGVKMELLDGNGLVVETTFTDSDGQYRFDNLPPNTYSVHEFQPSGYFQGGQVAGSHGGDDSTSDLIQDVGLSSGDAAVHYDFCEHPGGSISGYVFRDGAPILTTDGKVPDNLYDLRDGLLTPDDRRLGGVLLELRFSDTAAAVMAADVLPGTYAPGPLRIWTDANGYYEFLGLPQGNYTIVEVDQPAGHFDSRDTPGSTSGMALNQNTALIPGLIDPFIQEGIPLRNDAILQVYLAAGQHSVLNNFSEVQVTTFFVPPPPPPPPLLPPPPPEPLLFVPPLPPLPPENFNPPLPPPEYIGGAGSAYSWHLSVVNAGLSRASSRSTKIDGLAWRPVLFVHGSQWKSEQLAGGTWTIDTLSPGVDRPIAYGIQGAIPITGDWNGDGTSEIGIFYKGEWLLDLNGNGKWDADDLWAKLGDEADLPVVGDWDGDGKDDIGIFGPEWAGDPRHHQSEPGLPDPHNLLKKRPKNVPPQPEQATEGDRLLKLTANGRERADLIDHVFYFGAESDIPIAGDWNGDGIGSIGIFRDGQWHFDKDGDGRWSKGDEIAEFGQDGDLPVVGDFNGDGIDEIGIYRAGKWIIDTNGNRRIDAADQVIELGTSNDLPVVGDFDGNGTDEPALYREK